MSRKMDYYDEIGKEYGIHIVTPQDKLDSYFAGLELIRGRPGSESGEASQWEAIGDQYTRMNETGRAKIAYESALKALQKAQTSQWFTAEEKAEWEKELLAKLNG